jgi:acetyltransferase, GNAT family
MKISRLSINDLLKYDTEKYVKENILNTFSSRKNNNVEDFLHNKAIFFEKSSISTTHLIFDNNDTLLGYFSVANKSLILPNERFENLSNSKQKKLMQSGQKVGNGFYLVNSYLLGQLGKNFNLSESEQIKGNFLLSLAFELLLEAKELINAKYVWLECRNSEKLVDFYKKFGFEKIDNFISKDGLVVMMMKLDRKN